MNNRIVKTTTMAAVIATLAGTALATGIAPTAFAAAANDIVISNPTNNKKTSINGHQFTAYRIATYQNVRFDGTGDARHATGYDMLQDDTARGVTLKALTTAVTDSTYDKNKKDITVPTKVNAGWDKLVELDNGTVKFIGDAENLTPIQFIGKYFYGAGADVYGNDKADKAEMRTFANSMKLLGGLTGGVKATGANDKVKFDFDDTELGLYLIVEDTPATGNNTAANGNTTQTISRAMVTGTAFKDGDNYVNKLVNDKGTPNDTSDDIEYILGELKLKADAVTIKKQTSGQLIGVNSTRTFTITTNVPNYMNDYQDWIDSGKIPEFTVGDNPSDNLQVSEKGDFKDVKNLKVEATDSAGNKIPDTDVDYTISAVPKKDAQTPDDPNDFKIDFNFKKDDGTLDSNKLKKLSGASITITYDATVKNLADITDNDATVDYSNDPYSESNTTSKDNKRLYEADVELQKVKFNDASKRLYGAKFDVTKDGKPVKFKAASEKTDDKGTQDTKDDVKYIPSYTVEADGTSNQIIFGNTILKGLAADSDNPVTYHFKEAEAPAGYILGDNPVEFDLVITPTITNGELTKVNYTINSSSHANFLDLGDIKVGSPQDKQPDTTVGNTTVITGGVIDVENTTDINDFAKTGGQIAVYIMGAAALAVAGAYFTFLARRNRAKKTA